MYDTRYEQGKNLSVVRRAKLLDLQQKTKETRKTSKNTSKFSGGSLSSSSIVSNISGLEPIVGTTGNLSQLLTNLFKDAYNRICVLSKSLLPCHIVGLSNSVSILEDGFVQVMITATVSPFFFLIYIPTRSIISFF